MANQDDMRDGLKLADRATLSLLSALEDDGQATQRGLAQRIGVALGMTNSLLKRAVRKGLIKVKDVPAKRYVYYVTPKGFSEKSRLVAEYLSTSLTFFRQARDEYTVLYHQAKGHGHKTIVLYGISELAEIALMSAQEAEVDVGGVIQIGSNQPSFSNVPVYSSVEAALAENIDAVVITGADAPQDAYEHLLQHFDDERIFTAPLLHVSRANTGES